MRTLDSLNPQHMRNWFLEVLNRQGQWSRAWSCTKCGAEVTRRVTVNNTDQCLADVTCGKAQLRICENRRLKRGKHQQPETTGAWATGCEEGGAQQHMGLGKRGAGDQSPKRSNCCEASAGGRHEQGMLDRCSMTEGARESRSAGGAVGAAHAERRSTGMEGGDSAIEGRKPEDPTPRNGARTDSGKERSSSPCQDRRWGVRGVQLRHREQQRLLHRQPLERGAKQYAGRYST